MASKQDPPTFVVERIDQLAELTSPARLEILDAACAAGPCTAAELGRLLGRAPDSLYYHLRRLVRVELLAEEGGGPDGATYTAPARVIRMSTASSGPKYRALMSKVMLATLRATQRDLTRSIDAGGRVGHEADSDAGVGRVKGWLTSREQEKVNTHLRAIHEILHRSKPRPGARLFAIGYGFAAIEAIER
ncbi:MAG: helix-turn-helix domain-containing protein [Planctomycetota bacterium]